MRRPAALGDSWYARELGCEVIDDVATSPVWARLIASGPGRGLALWWFGRRYAVIVTTLAAPATRTLLCLERAFGRRGRHLVMLEFIPVVGRTQRSNWGASPRLRTRIGELYWELVAAPVLRRCVLRAHSLTRWESERNARLLGIEEGRFRFIPFFGADVSPDAPLPAGTGVLASGRAACDWETVFAAARGQGWALTAICSARDLPRVRALSQGIETTVLCDVSREEHQSRLADAAVYVLALREAQVSSGHVRLGDAQRAGTPVVAATVRGIEDYVTPERDVVGYPPGDWQEARTAVSRVLADPELGQRVATAARDRGRAFTRGAYLSEVTALMNEAISDAAR